MIETIRNSLAFWAILASWVVFGIYGGPAVYGIVLLSIVLFWRRNMYAELLIGFWFILIMSDSLEYQMAWAKTLKNVYIVLMAGILFADRHNFAPFNPFWRRFIPFFIVATISLVVASPVFMDGLQRTLSYFLIFLVAPNFISKMYRDEGPEVFRKMLYMAVVVLVLGLVWRFIDMEVAVSHGDRFRGLFGNPNGIGLFLIVVYILFTVVQEKYELFSRNERLIFYGLVGISLILSGSRNALISISLFIIFARFFRISSGLGLIAIVIFYIGYQFISANLYAIVSSLGLQEYLRIDSLESGSGRLIAWQFAWETIQDSIWLGRGFSFDLHLMRSNFDWLSAAGHEGGVHNSYLILWLNTGLIGIIFYFRALFLTFIEAAKRNTLAVPAMVAVLFSISFEPWLAASLNPYTIVFLIFMTIFIDPVFDEVPEEKLEEEDAPLLAGDNSEMILNRT